MDLLGKIYEKRERPNLALRQYRNAAMLAGAKGKGAAAFDSSVAQLETVEYENKNKSAPEPVARQAVKPEGD